ncbi:MAG: hypothetical protein HKP61_21685 [Dactylosporangium sp.]|nr:hypothetical protein [Dactylosporangium sp.]NNJ63494.1 hypothetical protein [Dactylosporangium sp.]
MADQTTPTPEAGARQRGRDRRHLYPGRRARIAPTFTETERAGIVSAAAAVGLTPTGFCAEAALAAAHGIRSTALDPERETLAEVQTRLFAAVVAVNRIGTNLNQAVAAFHVTGQPPPWLERAVSLCERRMRRLDETVASLHDRLP